MPGAANVLLAANQPQGLGGLGQSINASQMLGLGAPGGALKDQLTDQIKQRRASLDLKQYGAASALFGDTR